MPRYNINKPLQPMLEGLRMRAGWFIAAGLAASVAACSSAAIKQGMKSLEGQPLNAAIAKLGVPTEERTIAGQKVYIWLTRTLDEGTELKCQIRVIMSGDLISSWDFEGNEGYCGRYANRLRT
jgi:hypothetical protein